MGIKRMTQKEQMLENAKLLMAVDKKNLYRGDQSPPETIPDVQKSGQEDKCSGEQVNKRTREQVITRPDG
jgi:hypothetical protein